MAARTGLSTIIAELRRMTAAGTADYSVAGTAYWSDVALQSILDRHARKVKRQRLTPLMENSGTEEVYLTYVARQQHWETIASGTAVFRLEDNDGNQIGTANYTPDYNRGEFVFSADQGGSARYLTGTYYDLNAAAAEVWETKAAQVWDAVTFNADGQSFNASDMYKHAIAQAKYYRQQRGVTVSTMRRAR